MKTYARKRREYREIEGVHDLCRLCLEKVHEGVPIFTDANGCAGLALRIMICVGLEMTDDNCLPNAVCQNCYKELERYYSFRKKCEASYQKLKFHALALKEQEYLKNNKSNLNIEEKCENDLNLNSESEGQNLVFTINLDGTITLCENNVPVDGPLVTLTLSNDNNTISQCNKLDATNAAPSEQYNEPMNCEVPSATHEQRSLLLINNTNNNDNDIRVETNGFQSESQRENQSLLDPVSGEVTENTVEVSDTTKTVELVDLSTFLSTMLLELGIVTPSNNSLELNCDRRLIELETGDGNQISIELEEEDAEEEQPKQSADTVSDNKEDQNISIVRGKSQKRCKICDKTFVTSSVLARHIRAVHDKERQYACRTCGKQFAQKEVMLRHEHVHKAERPFKCGVCPKSFTQRANLRAHAHAHLPAHARALSIHRCPLCPKLFLYSSGLSRHMSTHAGRLYVCSSCDRSFHDKSALRRHMNTAKHHTHPT